MFAGDMGAAIGACQSLPRSLDGFD